MEVNHERLPSLAPFDLIVARGANSAKAGPLFLDCLQPAITRSAPVPPPPTPTGPRASDVEPPQAESEPVDAAAESDDATEDERDNEEDAVDAQAIPIAAAPPPANDEVPLDVVDALSDVASAEVLDVKAVAVPATEAPAVEIPDAPLPIAEEPAVTPQIPEELIAPEAASGADQLSTTKQAATEKRKVSKTLPTAPEEAAKDASVPEKDLSETSLAVPVAEPLENTTMIAQPETPPLDSTHSEDSRSDTPANDAATAVAEAKAIVAAVEPATQPTSTESAASNSQPTANPAVGATTAMAPKAPAVLLKGKVGSTESARPAGEIDPAKFLSRVVKAFESAQQRGSEVRLRLHPVELGALSIEVKIHDSVLTATVQAETSEAKAAIIDNLPALRERLADQGIRIDQFDVDLMDHSDRRQQSLDEQASRQEERTQQSARTASRRIANSEQPVAPTSRQRAAGPGGLNVII